MSEICPGAAPWWGGRPYRASLEAKGRNGLQLIPTFGTVVECGAGAR